MKVDVFLNFNGNAKEASEFYEKAFGIEAEGLMKFKDMPPSEDFKVAEKDMEKVMYVNLPIGKNSIMMSDIPDGFGYGESKPGTNFSICVSIDTVEDLERTFKALSEGGKVTMPLSETFFSKHYGELDDKFGVHWALLIEEEEKKEK